MLDLALSLLSGLKNWPARSSFRRALDARPFALPRGKPVLNYGAVLPARDAAIVQGGRVKLLHLRDRFSEQADFNLLYLVSSAPPPYAPDLVRWAKTRGARFVWNQNGVAFPAWAGSRVESHNRPMAAVLREAEFVVFQSSFCRESADRFLGKTSAPSEVLFNPVDLDAFAPAERAPSGAWQLLTAGTHHQAFRVIGPLETLRCLLDAGHDAQLTVAGEMRWPDAEAEVEAAVARLRVAENVTFLPPFTQREAAELYRGAHVLLHPKYQDPCPTVVIEALASGLPVVASASGGLPELVGEEGGELIEVPLRWDRPAYPAPESMALAVERIMAHWAARSRSARERAVRLFDARDWVEAHARIFERLISR